MKHTRLLCTAAFLSLTPVVLHAQSIGSWSPTDSMSVGRTGHRAIVLSNGNVLVCGGAFEREYLASSEMYRPDRRAWSRTASMSHARYLHTATLLKNGRVLVTGGIGKNGIDTVCEVYDPATDKWSETGWLNQPRHAHTATLLANGQVVVVGGARGQKLLRSCEGYDPGAGEWGMGQSMKTARASHSATLLRNGLVLVVGGDVMIGDSMTVTASCELFDPVKGIWHQTGSLIEARANHAVVMLEDGRVLVIGGSASKQGELRSCEVYDPKTGTWSTTGAISTERAGLAVTVLATGEVLAVGGYNSAKGRSYFATSEVYDPRTGVWRPCASISQPSTTPTLSVLHDGRVLLAGGFNMNDYPRYTYQSRCELYTPPQNVLSVADNAVTGAAVSISAWPNPVTAEAMIRYTLPTTGRVTITLFDVLGRVVAQILDATTSAGSHQTTFTTSNLAGGTYYLHLDAGGSRRVTPIVIRH